MCLSYQEEIRLDRVLAPQLHIDNTMYGQAADRVSSINRHSTRPETRRQRGLVSAQASPNTNCLTMCNHRDMSLLLTWQVQAD